MNQRGQQIENSFKVAKEIYNTYGAEFYNCAVEVMRGAEIIDEYIALPNQEAFDIEYWALEEAKLRRMPPEKEFAREVVVIIGAGSGIGKAAANHLIRELAINLLQTSE